MPKQMFGDNEMEVRWTKNKVDITIVCDEPFYFASDEEGAYNRIGMALHSQMEVYRLIRTLKEAAKDLP